MFTNWAAALKKRDWYIGEHVNNVVIVAVWLKGFPGVYDAYNITGALDIDERDVFLHEVLVRGPIWANDYRILAILPDSGKPKPAVLSLVSFNLEARIPPDFISGVREKTEIMMNLRPNATKRLQNEVFSLTGTRDDDKFYRLVLSIVGLGYTSEGSNKGTTPTIISLVSGPLRWCILSTDTPSQLEGMPSWTE
ncbi:uncharacterized protein C8A04DRAFT_32313 [Dichotomopilus funicola]|uniref:Uncharacterized protein n=1 Tax=Dichotomopilus funicola TaxID=1934379 RepID=A0AAN6UVW7_9PEZI|nr:hypothetical protein C8A04DRAFT_32313 [Dichotomopilus funicola]